MDQQPEKKENDSLRQKAEQMLDNIRTDEPGKLPAEELRRLVQELHIYQIELEMQNEQLRATTLELQESQKKYEDLYHFAPAGYLTLDEAGLICEANQMAHTMLVHGKFLNRGFAQFVAPQSRNDFYAFFKKVQESKTKQTTELILQTPQGAPFFALVDGIWWQENLNKCFCRLAITDISAQKSAEEGLRKSQELLQTTQQIARLGSWEYYPQTGFTTWSDEVFQIYSLDPNRVRPDVGLLLKYTHPDDRAEIQQVFNGNIPAGEPVTFYRRIIDAKGNQKFLQTTANTSTNEAGEILKITGAVQDITYLKRTEQELQEKEHFLRQVTDASPDVIFVYDLESHKNLYLNRQIIQLLGYSPEQVQAFGENFLLRLAHPDDLEILSGVFDKIKSAAGEDILDQEFRLKNAGGEYRWVSARFKVFKRNTNGVPCQTIAVFKDITNRKITEEELKTKNKIITGMLSNLPVVVSIIAADGTIQSITGSGLQSIGRTSEELVNTSIYDLFPAAIGMLNQLQSGTTVGFENTIATAGGVAYFQNYFFADPDTDSAIGFSIDLSSLKQAQQQVKIEKEFSESLLDNSVDGILAFDADMRITAWNKVLERSARHQKEEVLGKRLFDLFPDLKESDGGQSINKVLKGERVTLFNQNLGLRFGEFELFLNPLFNDNLQVTGGLAILHDVTIRNRMEAERTSEKLEQEKETLNVVLQTQEDERRRIAEILHNSLGQLLYGIKLNFEQYKSLQKILPPEKDETAANISELLNEAIKEVRTISFELMPTILEDFGLAVAIDELCRKLSSPSLQFKCFNQGFTKRQSKSVEIILYRIVQELINNIIKHARSSEAIIHLIRTKQNILISVEDNGIGIDQTKLNHYKGGIGLKSIRSQLKLINAQMNIESKPGKGTIITLKMPV